MTSATPSSRFVCPAVTALDQGMSFMVAEFALSLALFHFWGLQCVTLGTSPLSRPVRFNR